MKSCSTTRASTKGISSTRAARAASRRAAVDVLGKTLRPSQLRSTDSSTSRIETGVLSLAGSLASVPAANRTCRSCPKGLEGPRVDANAWVGVFLDIAALERVRHLLAPANTRPRRDRDFSVGIDRAGAQPLSTGITGRTVTASPEPRLRPTRTAAGAPTRATSWRPGPAQVADGDQADEPARTVRAIDSIDTVLPYTSMNAARGHQQRFALTYGLPAMSRPRRQRRRSAGRHAIESQHDRQEARARVISVREKIRQESPAG